MTMTPRLPDDLDHRIQRACMAAVEALMTNQTNIAKLAGIWRDPAEPFRPQWEYVTVQIDGDLLEGLQKWGAEAWELVMVLEANAEEGFFGCLFKRRKIPAPAGAAPNGKGKSSILSLEQKIFDGKK